MTENTLLLNAGFEPLRIINWERAFVLFFQGKVEILEEYGSLVHTVSRQFKIPAVVRLRRWVNLKRQTPIIRFSRANIYARDDYRCQYCYQRFSERELTLDHVKPVVRGGKKTWENIVAACMRCNQKKSDRTPEEVGFKLLRSPHAPRWLPGMMGTIRSTTTPELWQPYLALGWQNLNSLM
jgi:5-methylcytosine-specific restriction endonuclease McrA